MSAEESASTWSAVEGEDGRWRPLLTASTLSWTLNAPMPTREACEGFIATYVVPATDSAAPAPAAPTEQEAIEQVAQWLAEQSGHVRYHESGLGWKALVGQEGNVVHAHAEARRRQTLAGLLTDPGHGRALDEARDVLVRHARSTTASG